MEKKAIFTTRTFLILCILGGIGAATVALVHDKSLWLDEAMVALNVVNRSYRQLLLPLDYGQMAPVGFLLAEKSFAVIFGHHDWALRLFPFILFLGAIPIFYSLCRQVTKSVELSLFAVALFSMNLSLIYYASEVKQYMTDVFVSITVMYITLRFGASHSRREVFILSITGVIAVWFSNISVMVLSASGVYLLYSAIEERKNLIPALIPMACWGISFLVYYFSFIWHHPFMAYQVDQWKGMDGFIPHNIFSDEFLRFSSNKLRMIIQWMFGVQRFRLIAVLIFLTGIFAMLKNRKMFLLFFLPVVIHLILSALRLYPFQQRLTLYLFPLLMVIGISGLGLIFQYAEQKFIKITPLVLLVPVLFYVRPIKEQVPVERAEIKPVMKYLNEHVAQGELVYVSCFTEPAFHFYQRDYDKLATSSSVVIGKWDLLHWDKSEDEIFRNSPVIWFIISHERFEKVNGIDEKDYILNRLEDLGYRIVDKHPEKAAFVYKLTRK